MISNAYAQAAAPAAGANSFMGFLPIIVIFVLMYFMMIRPQMKRAKEQRTMIDALQKGDEVIAAGIYGKVGKMTDNVIGLDIGEDKLIFVQKQAVSTLLPKGTLAEMQK